MTARRLHAFPSILVLAMLLAGCSGPGTGGGATSGAAGGEATPGGAEQGLGVGAEEATAAPDADGDQPRVAFIPQIVGIPYYDGFEEGALRAAEEFGVDFTQSGPANAEAPEQLRIFEGFVTQGYDAVAVSPLDPTTLQSAISQAVESDVLVVTSDADAAESDRAFYVAQATDEALGHTLIDELVEQIGGAGQIGIVSGVANTPSLDAWVGFMQERIADEYPEVEVVGGVRHAPDSEVALEEAQNLMTAFPEIEGLVGVPSTAVPGVAQAVQNAGRAGEVAVIGYGSPNTARPFVESGVMENTVLWNVEELGYLTVWAIDQQLQGNEFEATNEVPGLDRPIEYDEETKTLLLGPPVIYDESNIDDFDF